MKVKTRKSALKLYLSNPLPTQVDLTLLRSLNMRRQTAGGSLSKTSGQDLGKEVVELAHQEKLERSKEGEERRARRSAGSETSGGEPKPFSGGDPGQFSGDKPRPAPLHTLALLVTLADLPLSDNCLASLLCRIADHPLLGATVDSGRNCGGRKCGVFLL